MRLLAWLLGGLVALALGAFALQMVAAETGEVATLHVVDSDGTEHSTRVWVVDDLGHVWIRGGDHEGGWASRAAAHPKLELERGGTTTAYLAIRQKELAVRKRINFRFNEKYGWRDTLISRMIGDPKREGVIVMKLRPREADSSPESESPGE